MRRPFALTLLICSLACGCAAGLAAPAALAAGSGKTGTTAASTTQAASGGSSVVGGSTPGLSLSGAEQQALQSQVSSTPTPAATTSSSGGGFTSFDAFITALVAALVLGGIAFWVWYDSRGHAARVGHGRDHESIFGQRAHAGSKAPHRPRKLKPAERKRRKRGRAR
jgi:hypothetical protein